MFVFIADFLKSIFASFSSCFNVFHSLHRCVNELMGFYISFISPTKFPPFWWNSEGHGRLIVLTLTAYFVFSEFVWTVYENIYFVFALLSTILSLWQFTEVTRKVLQNRLFMFHLKSMTNELFYYSLRCVCTFYKVHINTMYTFYKVLFSQSLRAPLKFIENSIQMNVLYPSIVCSLLKSPLFLVSSSEAC